MIEAAKSLFLILSALFPIVDPLGGSPIFLAMTREYSPGTRRALSWRIAVNSFFPVSYTHLDVYKRQIVPSGQNAALTPTIASFLPIQRNGSPGLISPDYTNVAPRLGGAYQIASKLVLRAGYGIFYGGQELSLIHI